MNDVDLGIQLELELQQWNRNMDSAIRAADSLDDALEKVVKQANDLQKALNDALGGGGGDVKFAIQVDDSALQDAMKLQQSLQGDAVFNLGVDTSEIELAETLKADLEASAAFDLFVGAAELEAAARNKESLGENVNFAVAVSDAELQAARRAVEALDESVTLTVNVTDQELDDARQKHDDLDNSVTTTVNVNDAELDEAKRKRDDIGAPVDTKINVDDTEVKSVLEQIRNLQTVDLAFTVGGAALGAGQTIFDFAASGIFEMDTALAKLQGTTNETIPGARELIEDLYTNAWGESRTQIAGVIGLAQQFGIDQGQIAGAVESAYELSSVMGTTAEESLRTLHDMVTQDLAPDYERAGDIVVAAFQEGANKGDDLLEALFEYSPNLAQLRLTGEGAANAIVGGIDAGFMNADYVGDSLRELSIKIFTEWSDETQAALKKIDYFDETELYRQGEMGGDEWLSGLVRAIEDAPEIDQQPVAAAIFGTTAEDFSAKSIAGLDPLVNRLGDVQGRLGDAATTVNSDIQTAFTELKRTIETELANAIDDTFDIQGLIDKAKEAVITFADEMQAGNSFFGSAEIALNLPGLENTMQELQQIFANVGIAIMQAMSDVLDTLGQNAAANSIDQLVADMAQVQLDIEMGTADDFFELEENVNRAVSRGVSQGDLLPQLIAKFNSAIESGDFNLANAIMHEIDALEVEGVISVANLFDTNQDSITDMADALHIAALSATGEAANRIDPSQIESFANALMAKETLYDTLYSNLTGAVDEAIANSDLSRLMDLSQIAGADGLRAEAAANQLKGFYESAVTDALARMDLTAAQENLRLLGDHAPESLTEQADQLAVFLEEEVQSALSRREPELALDYAKLLGREDLIAEVQAIVDAMHPIETAFSDTMNAAQGSVTQNTDMIALDMGDLSTSVSTGVSTVKEDMKALEEAYRVAADTSGKSMGDMATQTDTAMTDVGTSTGETATKLGEDSKSMEDSVIGTAVELGLQALAMGLSFLAISASSQRMQENVSDTLDDLNLDLTESAQAITDFSGTAQTDFDTIGDSINGSLAEVGNYVVSWADTVAANFELVGDEFTRMAGEISVQASGLSSTLESVGEDVQGFNASVGAATAGGGDSGGGSAEAPTPTGQTINGMARRDPDTRPDMSYDAAIKAAATSDYYFDKDADGTNALVSFDTRQKGYWRWDREAKIYRWIKSQQFSQVYSEDSGSAARTSGDRSTNGASSGNGEQAGAANTKQLSAVSRELNMAVEDTVRSFQKLIDALEEGNRVVDGWSPGGGHESPIPSALADDFSFDVFAGLPADQAVGKVIGSNVFRGELDKYLAVNEDHMESLLQTLSQLVDPDMSREAVREIDTRNEFYKHLLENAGSEFASAVIRMIAPEIVRDSPLLFGLNGIAPITNAVQNQVTMTFNNYNAAAAANSAVNAGTALRGFGG